MLGAVVDVTLARQKYMFQRCKCVFLEFCEVGSWHIPARELSLEKFNGFRLGLRLLWLVSPCLALACLALAWLVLALPWLGLPCLALPWPGLACRFALPWLGLAWLGLPCLGLAWLTLACFALPWLGLPLLCLPCFALALAWRALA